MDHFDSKVNQMKIDISEINKEINEIQSVFIQKILLYLNIKYRKTNLKNVILTKL